jgi:hypothetical protein
VPPAVTEARREAEIAEVLDTLGADARKRIASVRNGLQSILEVLSKDPGAAELAPLRRTTAPARKNGSSSLPARASAPARTGAPARTTAAKRRAPAPKVSKTTKRRRAGA